MNELISVIINVYNAEKYIKKCLESIINQTYKNIEILIINDGSTDNTLNICKSYNDERIRIINQENLGLSLSRNVGIDNAKGDYLYFVDADDFVQNDVIEYLYQLIKKYDVKMASTKPLHIYNYDYKMVNNKEKIEVLSSKQMLSKIMLSEDEAGTIWNKLFKKELFDNIRFEKRIINDVVVIYKVVLECEKIVYSNQIKYFYLKHKESILGQKKIEHSKDLYFASIERYNYIKKIYPNYYDNEICLNFIIMNLYLHDNIELSKFLDSQNAMQLFKNKFLFFKVLFSNLKFRTRIKMILFRIKPSLCMKMVKKYITLKDI